MYQTRPVELLNLNTEIVNSLVLLQNYILGHRHQLNHLHQ